MRLFAFLFIPAKGGGRKSFEEHSSPYLRPPLTRAEWDRRKVARDLYISRLQPLDHKDSQASDEQMREVSDLMIGLSRIRWTQRDIALLRKAFAEVICTNPESEYPIPRSVWTRLVGWWKKLLMGVRVQ